MLVKDLAGQLGLRFEGDGTRNILAAAPLDGATCEQIAFVGHAKAAAMGRASAAGCLIVPPEFENHDERTLLRADSPRAAFAAAVALLHPPEPVTPGVHPTAAISPGAVIHSDCEIGPNVTVAAGARIASACRIGPGCSIGARSSIGSGSILHANVSIYSDVTIGDRAILHSGCIIGADGFGFALHGDRYVKFPQIGRVEVGDDVEIGANSTVDRAALGVTRIGSGTKLDNMVHIGHNCRIGSHVVIAAQTGLSGGVVVEDYAVIGGQVGIGDKARIESKAVLGSGCGVLTSKVVHGGQVVWGTPARPLKEHLTQLANLSRLPDLRAAVSDIERRLAELEARST